MLYLECASGISGDMTVAALLDAGASEERLLAALASLPVSGFEVRVTRVRKAGLDACDFDVVLDAEHENRDHDMEYLHGEGAGDHNHDHAHAHDHEHGDARAHDHFHEHRNLADIFAIIDAADLAEGARALAHRIFEVLAEAEAKAHGVGPDEVHFHEVGAIDSIVDIVAVAVCLDDLAPDEVVVTELSEGRGTVRCQHGVIPVPVPATLNIAAAHGIALRILNVQGELVTPTGAAIAAAARTRSTLPDRFAVKRVGTGAGKRAYETPGILRALLIEEC